ncbi:MAG: L-serine ammonia-lyase, iron-sulfur-dependent, subunit alpha [Clostridia bacterium]|nr:L-serine ammonia-lyase, iron-sulfur-dependent, subunit alpha [Clostridia bacterium]
MRDYTTIQELVNLANEKGGFFEAVLDNYAEDADAREAAVRRMADSLNVMRDSVKEGLNPDARSMSGRVGGQAAKLLAAVRAGKTFGGNVLGAASAYALAAAECNACMGRIVAAPTAGACGVLPAALFAAQEEKGYTDEQLVRALFTAAGFGKVIALRSGISGAEGGCQAECGSASAMAAAALCDLAGGTPEACADAAGFAGMNLLGLVCDPVEGLVEVPCVYRNIVGVANAVCAANLAISGVGLIMPADEVIDAMRRVGRQLPASLRETGEGGCAACRLNETGRK